MTHEDFCILTFNEHIGNKKEDIPIEELAPQAEWQGDNTSTKEFWIEGVPLFGHAYALITVYDVHFYGHRLVINGQPVSEASLTPNVKDWQTCLIPINVELKANSNNTVQIRRSQDREDNFIVRDVIIHWRETRPDDGKSVVC